MIEGFVNLGMKQKRSKAWGMKWHWLIDKEFLDRLIVYCYEGTNNNANYFTNHHPTIHYRQMRTCYIHTLNLVRTIPQTIRLREGVFNRIPGTKSRIKYLNVIQSKPQSMTKKRHTVRQLTVPNNT